MRRGLLLIAGVAVLLAAVLWQQRSVGEDRRQRVVALFGTLPILWRESEGLADLVASDAERHWALALIEEHGRVQPVDTLLSDGAADPLSGVALLIMAQPRPLSPEENVALDDWVRRGGRVLLFADPMLTAHSAFPPGDKRRPQDTVLLSPILARWGLRLEFDEDQPLGERPVESSAGQLPVNLPGRLVATADECRVDGHGLVARCAVGEGAAMVVADAALLEDAPDPARSTALRRLLEALETDS